VQYFDRYGGDVRDDYLFHTFDVITDLDPEFYEAYVFGSLFLSLDKRWDLLYRLEDKGIAANPKNWLIPWDAGTYAFFQAKDYDKAQHYLSIANGRNGKIPVIQRLLANVFKYKRDYRESLSYWLAIRDQYAHDDSSLGSFMQMAAERNIFDLTIRLDLEALQGAVERYKSREGTLPFTLETLVTAGLLPALPQDPTGKPYLYDRKTGEVTCQSPFKFKGRFGQW
jgi:tetratricopeptide (TPR) repeat protein